MTTIPGWPPSDDPAAVLAAASDWALGHGLAFRPTDHSTTSAIHGPFALYPTAFPRSCFEQAQRIQTIYNALYANLASDEAFLEQVIGAQVAKVDEFQGELWKIWQTVKEEGLAQDLTLGLFRSDYLLHTTPQDSALSIKQVEFNTISSSFGPLASKVTDLHRFLAQSRLYPARQEVQLTNLPQNPALEELAAGLAAAHKAYGNPEAAILMVVQENERNIFDQRLLEWELLDKHNIRLIRRTFPELSSTTLTSSQLIIDSSPISVIYYRAGYTPNDYPSSTTWSTRLTLERSNAVKCPSVALQLAGAKKVQQVLASEPGLLEQYLSKEDALEMRKTFVGMWGMDSEGEDLARREYDRMVLKPQREGGGNNCYKGDIPGLLDEMVVRDKERKDGGKEREGYILMELIQPPEGVENVLVKAGTGQGVRVKTISELGVYGVCLYKRKGKGAEVLVNKQAGHLLRTKGSDSHEGGVVVGASGLDSVLLV